MPVVGTAVFEWIDWHGNVLSVSAPNAFTPSYLNETFEIPFTVGAINTTRILTYNNVSSLFSNQQGASNTTGLAASNALLRMSISASPTSYSNTPTLVHQPRSIPPAQATFTHSSYFHPLPLSQSMLVDPALTLSYDTSYIGQVAFTVTAEKGVAAWVWLDYPSGDVQGYFDDNGFWLAKGEYRTVMFVVWEDWTGDRGWTEKVTVRSLWDNLVDE